MEAVKQEIFASKFASINLSDNINIDALYLECKRYEKENKGRIVSNKGGYQSNDLLFYDMEKQGYVSYCNLIHNIEQLLSTISESTDAAKIILNNIWINVNYNMSFNWKHSHPGSVFSGTFYVNVPEDSNAAFVFERDILFQTSMYAEWLATSKMPNEQCDNQFHTLLPKNGDLILFPSYLEHRVDPNLSEKERISISFNTNYLPSGD